MRSLNPESVHAALEAAAARLRDEAKALCFGPHAAYIYHPLDYAWEPHRQYLGLCARPAGGVLFLGMNPGPFGMVQTGVPFGEVAAVRDWMGIRAPVHSPSRFHPRRPVEGFHCKRSEVSGRRLWGLMSSIFPSARDFFDGHAVMNYCPVAFVTASGANLTPDKLPAPEKLALYEVCDRHLAEVVRILRPKCAVGVGGFATARLRALGIPAIEILHPSPASPAANRGWAQQAMGQLGAAGLRFPSPAPSA